MSKKTMNIAITLVIIVSGLLIGVVFSNQKTTAMRHKSPKSENKLKLIKVKLSEIQSSVNAGGTLQALNKIEIFAEVSGVLEQTEMSFRPGNHFEKDEILIKINDDVFSNNVLAQKSSLLNQLTLFIPDLAIDFPESAAKWENYLENFDLQRPLLPLPGVTNTKEKYFIASKNIFNLYYAVKSMEATLVKYTIRAPYKGVVTESNINPGTLVRAGQKLGEFANNDIYELEAPLNIADLPFVKRGDKVTLKSMDMNGIFSGTVKRINNKIDRNSQTVRIYIIIRDVRLKDGMYLTANIKSSNKIKALKVPAKWLVNQNNIYVKRDSGFVLQEVEVLRNENDSVIITGLEEGVEILAQEAKVSGLK